MSDENVDLVEGVYALVGRRSLARTQDRAEVVDAAFCLYLSPDFEIHIPEGYPEGGEMFRGREGVEGWLRMIDDAWSEWRYEDRHFRGRGDTVVALLRVVAEGATSGLRLDREVAHVWRISDGRAMSVTVYLDRDEALEAAGLSE